MEHRLTKSVTGSQWACFVSEQQQRLSDSFCTSNMIWWSNLNIIMLLLEQLSLHYFLLNSHGITLFMQSVGKCQSNSSQSRDCSIQPKHCWGFHRIWEQQIGSVKVRQKSSTFYICPTQLPKKYEKIGNTLFSLNHWPFHP